MRRLLLASLLLRRSLLGFATIALFSASAAVRADEIATPPAKEAATSAKKQLPKDVEEILAAHEATLASIKTLHLKATVRMNLHGGEMKPYDETEWWRVGDRERFADLHFRDSADDSVYDPALREESSIDAKEVRSVESWNSDDARKTPIVPRSDDLITFARSKGVITPSSPGLRHGLLIQLMLDPGGNGLRKLLEEAKEPRVVSRDENAVTLELRYPTYTGILEFAPKQGYLLRRAEYHHQGAASDQPPTVIQVVTFAEGTPVPFPTKATSGYGDKVHLEATVSDLAINEPLEAERATVRFPEGGQVIRFDEGKTVAWYVWGKGEPRLTFDTQGKFDAWLSGAMKGAKEE